MSDFSVISGNHVKQILAGQEKELATIVEESYLAHDAGLTVNPDSYFLRFPRKPNARIIALPASLEDGDDPVTGIKWISSFPDNITAGQPRASAVLVLNDYTTGYPIALLEAAGISAARTAASAALATRVLGTDSASSVGIVGAGVIARTIGNHLASAGVPLSDVRCHDVDPDSAGHLMKYLNDEHGGHARRATLEDAFGCDLVVLATNAGTPYVTDTSLLRPGQVVLNVSLRDLAPELILSANNVFDDVEHCMKADTSAYLAEQLTGGRDFVTGTLAQIIRGKAHLDPERATVFSPFGLGLLDLAVGRFVLNEAREQGLTTDIPDFIGETARW